MLGPGDPRDDSQAMLSSEVKQPARRNGEGAEGVSSQLTHQRQVTLYQRPLREWRAMRGWREGAIRNTFKEEFFPVNEEEFSFGDDRRQLSY